MRPPGVTALLKKKQMSKNPQTNKKTLHKQTHPFIIQEVKGSCVWESKSLEITGGVGKIGGKVF